MEDIIDVTPCQNVGLLDKETADLVLTSINLSTEPDQLAQLRSVYSLLRRCYDLEKRVLYAIDDETIRRTFLARIDESRNEIYWLHAKLKNTVNLE